ncbi:helix-turn-helix domain-containing protein [Bifidobacterium olomucense]|uniref:helix-turn-helix domain-containing protein n=1 Tax=Bifidobacterium olomucense TaxID=2675324 RepID=UPI00145E1D22|nr:helix-turn-helix domain-containing protein [Bifidobacterium sp. DSM 109959]
MGTNKREITSSSIALIRAIEAFEAEAGIRTPALAKESGIPLTTLRKILTLKSAVDYEQLRKISGALNIKVSELVARAEDIAARAGLEDKGGDIH